MLMNITQNYEKRGLNTGVFCMIFSPLAAPKKRSPMIIERKSRSFETIIAVKKLRLTFSQ